MMEYWDHGFSIWLKNNWVATSIGVDVVNNLAPRRQDFDVYPINSPTASRTGVEILMMTFIPIAGIKAGIFSAFCLAF